jgi:hypothetical protein
MTSFDVFLAIFARPCLTEEAVAKVVPRGVTHLDMAPYDPAGPLVVAAGDKAGEILQTST